MKILQVISTWKGGAIQVVFDVTKALIHRGNEVTIYTTDLCKENLNLDVKAINDIRCFRTLFHDLAKKIKFYFTPELTLLAKEVKRFDVLHLHEYRTFQNIIFHHYARKYNVPYVLQAHGSLPRIMAKQRVKWIYDVLFGYRLLRDASKGIALSRVEAEQYMAMGVPEEKIAVIPNGIDLSEYADLPPKGSFKKKFGIDEDDKTVLYLGRIHESKGLDLLAEAFSFVLKDLRNVRLVVVGPDDGYTTTFSRLISHLGIEKKVLLTGFVEKRDKLAAFVDCDVFVTPRFHGFPVTFLEACLAECPIVTASDELDWINNNVGYVTENSSDAIAKATANVLQNEQINRKFRNNCKHIIKNFDISTVTRQLEKVYNEALFCGCY